MHVSCTCPHVGWRASIASVMALESLQDDLGPTLEEQPNSLVLQLLPELVGSDLAPIVFGGFLRRAAALLNRQLRSHEDVESEGFSKKLQYAAFILWALFSPARVYKEYAKSLHEQPGFLHYALQLNCSLLKARYLGVGDFAGDLAMVNTFSTLIMLALSHGGQLKDHLTEYGHLQHILQLLKYIPSKMDEEVLQATAVNLQILYQCARTACTHSVCSKVLFAQTIEPLLHSEYIQLRLISKALLVRLDVPVPPITTDEVATLLQFINVSVYDELTHSHYLSLINLLSITHDLAKSPQNHGNLANPDVLLSFSKLANELEEDLQQVVAEVIQMVSSNKDTPIADDQLTMEVDPSYQVKETGFDQMEEVPPLKAQLTEVDKPHIVTGCGTGISIPVQPLQDSSYGSLQQEIYTEDESAVRLVDSLLQYIDQSTDGTCSAVTAAFLLIVDITNQSDDSLQEKIVKTIAAMPNICRTLLQNVFQSDELGDGLSTCFVESLMLWTHYSPVLGKELGKAGVFQYLAAILHAADTCKLPSQDVIDIVLQTLTVFLNFAYDASNLPTFERGEIVPLLLRLARCPHFEVSFLSRIILSLVQPLLACDELLSLKLDIVEAEYIASAFQHALSSPNREAEGYTITELLRIATSFTNSSRKVPVSVSNRMLPRGACTEQRQKTLRESSAAGNKKAKITSEAEHFTSRKQEEPTSEFSKSLKENLEMLDENKSLFIETSLCFSIEKLLKIPDEQIQTATLRMLWNILHCPSAQQVLQGHLGIVRSVKQLQKHSSTQLKQAASCLLKLLGIDDRVEVTPLLYARVCYSYGLYGECIESCDLLASTSDQEPVLAKLLKGKAKFHAYQPTLRYLMENRYDLPKKDVKFLVEECFCQMKDAIDFLSNALDNQCIDFEGSMLLDFAMMDCIRETNRLNECKRCLLCRRQSELRKSHVWSESIIKRVSKKKFANMGAKNIMFGQNKHFLKSPGVCSFWMLCSKCEELLSQNGEKQFCEEFYNRISESHGQLEISYDSWLFDFCIGILFRTMSTLIMNDCLNGDEIYNVFLLCRKHLINLPVRISGKEVKPSQLEQYQVTSLLSQATGHLNPLLLVTPDNAARSGSEHPLFRGFDAFLQYYSERQMNNGQIDISGSIHFFLTYCAPIAIMLQFSPSYSCILPDHWHIKPGQAVYIVPDVYERAQGIPKGIWEAFQDYQQFHLDVNLEFCRSLSAIAATKLMQCLPRLQHSKTSQKESEQAPDASSLSLASASPNWTPDSETQNPISGTPSSLPVPLIPCSATNEAMVTQDSSNLLVGGASPNWTPDSGTRNIVSTTPSSHIAVPPVTSFSTSAATTSKASFPPHQRLNRLQFLPRGFEVKRVSQQLQFNVPKSHYLLLHTLSKHPEGMEMTCFLGTGSSGGFSPDKPYFIFIQHLPQEQLLIADGVFISLDFPVKVQGYILEHSPSNPLRIPLEEINDLFNYMLPTMLEQQGHTTIHSLVLLAKYYRPFHNQGGVLSLEFQCSSEGCWYCRNRCLTCMRPAAPWSGLVGGSTSSLGFCSRACKEVFCGEDGTYSPIVPERSQEFNPILFQQLSAIRSPKSSTNIVDFLHLCMGDGSPQLPLGRPYILWQIRSPPKQLFLNFFVSDDCELMKPVWYVQSDIDSSVREMVEAVCLQLKERLRLALHDMQFSNLSSLVTSRLTDQT